MNEPKPVEFLSWLAANVENVRNGAGSFQGSRVTGESLAVRYFTCLSFVFFTTRSTSPYLLQGTDTARSTAIRTSLLTFFLGWWGIPFGIIFTPIYLVRNIMGGEKCTVNDLISLLEKPEGFAKANAGFRYAPLVVIGGIFAFIVALMLALQVYQMLHPTKKLLHPVAGMSRPLPSAVVSDPVVARYMREVERKLKENWQPPKRDISSRAIVSFNIDKRGGVADYHILKSSNIKEVDDAAIKAVFASQPFAPLPAVLNDMATIEFTFDYNVWDHQHRKVPPVTPRTEDVDE